MLGCAENGVLNDSEFSKPLPWMGLYIVAGTFACTLAMAADIFSNFCHRKLWFPTKFFSLNATTLTFLGIATKLAVDLNTSMPRRQDQLAKLSSTALICTAIANFMPSLGAMGDSDIVSNVIALGIFVITVIVNVCMQMGTGVIYMFLPEHALILFFMLVLLLNLCSSALIITPTKQKLEDKYDNKCHYLEFRYDHMHSQVPEGEGPGSVISALKESVNKFWLMALTCSPQHLLSRFATCTASGALCLVSPLVLIEASMRSFVTDSVSFCGGTCDYSWSVTLVFYSQAIAIAVGTIAPAYRCFNTVSFLRSPRWSCDMGSVLEDYWIESLIKWRDAPLPFQIRSRRNRKIAHQAKSHIVCAFVLLHVGVVLVSKLIRLAFRMAVSFLDYSKKRKFCMPSTSNEESRPDSNSIPTDFVLHLDGEKDSVQLILTSGLKYIKGLMKRGKKKQPTNLISLIMEHSTENFIGVFCFDSDRLPILPAFQGYPEPRNCWALPVVTLTSIVVALSYCDQSLIGSVDSLVDAVSESLRYVRLVDKHLNGNWLGKMRNAADYVWLGIDLYDRWSQYDLKSLASGGHISMLERLGEIGKKFVEDEWMFMLAKDDDWSNMPLAANFMYRVTTTILLENYSWTTTELFQFLWMTISDILGACLTNLPRLLYTEYICNDDIKGEREESVRGAALLLLEVENILDFLGKREVASLYEGEQQYIDNWRKKMQKDSLHLPSSSNNQSGSTPPELSLSIN